MPKFGQLLESKSKILGPSKEISKRSLGKQDRICAWAKLGEAVRTPNTLLIRRLVRLLHNKMWRA
eukprot:6189451-Pleurochrysis_carterae.AAC.1